VPRRGPPCSRLLCCSQLESAAPQELAACLEEGSLTLPAFLAERSPSALLGWEVVLHSDGSLVGTVAEVLSASGGAFVLEVSGSANSGAPDPFDQLLASLGGEGEAASADSPPPENVLLRITCAGRGYDWHVYLPLAPPLVPQLDPGQRRLRAAPPAGLLELGERPALLAWLRQQLPPLLRPDSRLPSAAELAAAGRGDVAAALRRAGGAAAVATELRLPGGRKPPGFWHDLDMVAMELAEFTAGAWSSHAAAGGSRRYYYNDVTGELRWTSPDGEEAEARVMPPLAALAAAGRWDLYNAVRLHGGARAVREALGWDCARRGAGRELANLPALAEAVREAARAAGAARGAMPTTAQLLAADRADVLAALVARGGLAACAARLGLATQRSARGRWRSAEAAAAALGEHLRAAGRRKGGRAAAQRLPTQAALRAAGRADLAYALQRHGARAMAERLQLPRGRERGGKRAFAEARSFARALALGSQREWRAWSRGGERPLDIPADPYTAYRASGWMGWPDWLGY